MLFADAQYDDLFPGEVTLSYMICGARRTGTTFLSKLLWETGCLGKPFEYQLPECRQTITTRMPRGISYWDFLRKYRRTANGVFGFKEVAPSTYRLKNLVAEKALYLTRRDEVAQTVSLVLAEQTGAFFHFQDEKNKPDYNYDMLMNYFIQTCEVKREWERILEEDKMPTMRLIYEELDYIAVEAIAAFLAVPLEKMALIVPPMRKQATETNQEWEERFRKEMTVNGCSAP